MRDALNELLLRVAAGDLEAIESLHVRMSGTVHRIAESVLRDHHRAEDACQETFVRIWESAHRCQSAMISERAAWAWIARIAYTTAVDIYRKNRRESPQREIRPLYETLSPRGIDGLHDAMHVRELLGELTVVQRAVVGMIDLNGFSYDQCAKALCISKSSVKRRRREAHRLLQGILEPMSDSDSAVPGAKEREPDVELDT